MEVLIVLHTVIQELEADRQGTITPGFSPLFLLPHLSTLITGSKSIVEHASSVKKTCDRQGADQPRGGDHRDTGILHGAPMVGPGFMASRHGGYRLAARCRQRRSLTNPVYAS
jgi:hypothetical protein